jgi:hypothetical protein
MTEIQGRAARLGCQQRSCLGWRIDARGNAKLFQLLYVTLLEMKFCAAFAAWSKEHYPLEFHSTTTCHVSIPAQQRLRDTVHVLDLKGQHKPIAFCSGWHASTHLPRQYLMRQALLCIAEFLSVTEIQLRITPFSDCGRFVKTSFTLQPNGFFRH